MNAKKAILGLSYIYVGLPVMLFFLGWTKWWIAMPVCLLLIYSFGKAVNNETELWLPKFDRETLQLGGIVLLLIVLWVYFSGIGGRVSQTFDHYWRNTIFNILVEYDWPVQKEVVLDGIAQNRVMIYYIGFWLPAAVIGKLFGLAAGYTFQMFWAILGISLVYIYVTSFLKRMSTLPIIGMMLFSGLDYLGYFFTGADMVSMGYENHFETWNRFYQYSSFTTQLNWVYNQAIYAWLLVCLILIQKNSRQVVLIWGCGLISATLPFVGLIPFLVYKIIDNGVEVCKSKKQTSVAIRGLFTVENVYCGGCVGIMTFLYLIGNGTLNITNVSVNIFEMGTPGNYVVNNGIVGRITSLMAALVSNPAELSKAFWYILFIVLEIGVYCILIYRYQRNNILFYLTVITLCLVPKIEFGGYNEFCMRASIPALLVLFVLVMQAWYKALEHKDWMRVIALVLLLAIGARTTLGEFMTATVNTSRQTKEEIGIQMEMVEEDRVFQGGNFSGERGGNFFFEYLAK